MSSSYQAQMEYSGHMHFQVTGSNAVAQPSSDPQGVFNQLYFLQFYTTIDKRVQSTCRVLYCLCLIFFGVLKYYLTVVFGTFVHFYGIAMALWFPSNVICTYCPVSCISPCRHLLSYGFLLSKPYFRICAQGNYSRSCKEWQFRAGRVGQVAPTVAGLIFCLFDL